MRPFLHAFRFDGGQFGQHFLAVDVGLDAGPDLDDLAGGIDEESIALRELDGGATPKLASEPYSFTTFFSGSASRRKVRFSFVQNCLWLSVESTLTPTITAFSWVYFSWSRWKLWASMVQPEVISLG